MALAIKAKKSEAERVKRRLCKLGALSSEHRILVYGEWVYFPISKKVDGFEVEDVDMRERENLWIPPIVKIREALAGKIPEPLIALLPDKWESVGDVLILKLPERLKPYEKTIAQAYSKILEMRSVLNDYGGISGEFREPKFDWIYGDKNTETTHLENGIRYTLDPAKVMFASGNVEERIRMSKLKCRGEVVVDMFAGIGYFTLPLAVYGKPAKIYACEINPVSVSYLRRNAEQNGVSKIVEPLLGDCRKAAPEGVADRVVMGYVRGTKNFLGKAMRILKPEGGILHYHETYPNALLPQKAKEDIEKAAEGAGRRAEILRLAEVKSYSPGVSHIVVDFRVY